MNSSTSNGLDLVGEPFAVIESDPGVFSTFIRSLGVLGLQVTELYDIEPWAISEEPQGLIFCFLWHKDVHRAADFNDPDAERVWFANQLNDDACASLAILNVLLNNSDIELGPRLRAFKAETERMSSVMKGLAISNCRLVRQAQNSLARPADVRGSISAITTNTFEAAKKDAKPPPAKRRKTTTSTSTSATAKKSKTTTDVDPPESYHFIGYVPYAGKVWELDGLKPGPLEVGEIPSQSNAGWMDVARPALRMKMQKYGAGNGENIRFNLLAIVEDQYSKLSDKLELLKREKIALERRLNETYPDGWQNKVDPTLYASATEVFLTSALPTATLGRTFAPDFGSIKMQKDMAILDMPIRNLIPAWEQCIQAAIPAKIAVEDELTKPRSSHTDNVKRTFDYEPFIREFVGCCNGEGTLESLINPKKRVVQS